jgi:hypothetical protein
MSLFLRILLGLFSLSILVSIGLNFCSLFKKNTPNSISGILEPLQGAVYPPSFPPPTWRWQGRAPFAISLDSFQFQSSETQWQAPEDIWRQINHAGNETTLRVRDANGQSASVTFSTSSDPVTGSLFYREVILPFAEAVKDPSRLAWRFGPVTASAPPPIVLTGLPVCGNCHSFSSSGKVLGMDVDYANDKGSYAVLPTAPKMVFDREHIMTWSSYKPDDKRLTFGLLPRVSPDGRFVVATVKDRSVFVAMDDLAYSQQFFPVQGILVVYDIEKKTFSALPGADDPAMVQSGAVWSPDGQWIYFCKAPAVELKNLANPNSAMLTREEADRFFAEHPGYGYSIWRVPFAGGKGGTAEPVVTLSGRSCYFPRLSPDGKFLVFCQAKQHMLLQPDAELWIVPSVGGAPRRMQCNQAGMNSWHSFSPDGRWMVFASKAKGPYTQLLLTHIDANGKDSPAIPLERLVAPERAANIPEFVNLAPDAITQISEAFLDAVSHLRAGTDSFNAGDLSKAEQHFRLGLSKDPKEARLHFCLGSLLAGNEKLSEAITCFEAAVRLDPQRAIYHAYLARAYLANGEPAKASPAASTALYLATTAKDQETQNIARTILTLCETVF